LVTKYAEAFNLALEIMERESSTNKPPEDVSYMYSALISSKGIPAPLPPPPLFANEPSVNKVAPPPPPSRLDAASPSENPNPNPTPVSSPVQISGQLESSPSDLPSTSPVNQNETENTPVGEITEKSNEDPYDIFSKRQLPFFIGSPAFYAFQDCGLGKNKIILIYIFTNIFCVCISVSYFIYVSISFLIYYFLDYFFRLEFRGETVCRTSD
jgi:hypothetical protein